MLLAQSFPFFGFTFHQSSSQIRIQVHDESRDGEENAPKGGWRGGDCERQTLKSVSVKS